MIVFVLLGAVYSFELRQLPISRSTPSKMIHSTSAYNKSHKTIYTFGGEQVDRSLSNSLRAFNVQYGYWDDIEPFTIFKPPGLSMAKSFFRTNNQFYVLFGKSDEGISEHIYVFDSDLKTWKQDYLTGDFILPSIKAADCSYTYDFIEYIALYGGISKDGISDTFYM